MNNIIDRGLLEEAIRNAAKDGNIVVDGKVMRKTVKYLSVDVSASNGTKQLLLQSTTKSVGVTNFDGGDKLNAGRDLVVLGVNLKCHIGSAVPTAGTWTDTPLAPLKNGELRIIQDEERLNMPMLDLFNAGGVPAENEQNYFKVPLTIIKSNKTFKIEMETATAVAATTCIRVAILCYEFVA